MKIGETALNGYAALAPMAGVTDRAFREICLEYGAAYVVSEMVSSKGLTMKDRKSDMLMTLGEKENNAAVQIFGCEPLTMAEAAKKAEQTGCIAIDINMGCPAPKVAGHGGGSALMKSPELAAEITNAVVNAVKLPVTCKIRTGWDDDNLNAVEMALLLQQAGASALTIHGRTRKQMYAPPVNYDMIKAVCDALTIPVIGNGDIVDFESAKHMYEYTGCDFIMIGRGALGSPWLFRQIYEFFSQGQVVTNPTTEEKMDVMLRHITKLCEYKGDYVGIREARKHAGWYTKGMRGAAAFRRDIGALESLDELKALADKIIESQK